MVSTIDISVFLVSWAMPGAGRMSVDALSAGNATD